jgi:hypothetical protein
MIVVLLFDFVVPIALGCVLRAFGGAPLWVAAGVTCVCWVLLMVTFFAGEEFAEYKVALQYERERDRLSRCRDPK